MTNLRKRLENILTELEIIKEALEKGGKVYPSCCLTFHKAGEISCDVIGLLPKEDFLRECRKCRDGIEKYMRMMEPALRAYRKEVK
jgi:hypothetical protein